MTTLKLKYKNSYIDGTLTLSDAGAYIEATYDGCIYGQCFSYDKCKTLPEAIKAFYKYIDYARGL